MTSNLYYIIHTHAVSTYVRVSTIFNYERVIRIITRICSLLWRSEIWDRIPASAARSFETTATCPATVKRCFEWSEIPESSTTSSSSISADCGRGYEIERAFRYSVTACGSCPSSVCIAARSLCWSHSTASCTLHRSTWTHTCLSKDRCYLELYVKQISPLILSIHVCTVRGYAHFRIIYIQSAYLYVLI